MSARSLTAYILNCSPDDDDENQSNNELCNNESK